MQYASARKPSLFFSLLALTFTVGACSPANPSTDAGDAAAGPEAEAAVVMEAGPEAAAPDAGPDAQPSHLFGRCTQDSDCAGTGAICLTDAMGYPGGWCSRPCDPASSAPCPNDVPGINPVCLPMGMGGANVCVRSCMNGFDCGRNTINGTDVTLGGYTCVTVATNTSVCQPSCSDATCGNGTRCNHYSGRCQPMSTPYPPTGSDVGGTCTRTGTMSECRSQQCILEISATGSRLPTGYNSGYCIGGCTLPAGYNPSNLFPGTVLPQGNCPMGGLCFPSNNLAAGDPGTCLAECHADTDCRSNEGYFCQRSFTLGASSAQHTYTFTNGFCRPRDCNQMGQTCPMGYSCMLQRRTSGSSTTTVGVCRPNGPEPTVEPGPEAGVEPSMEAGAAEAGSPDAGASDAGSADASAMDASAG